MRAVVFAAFLALFPAAHAAVSDADLSADVSARLRAAAMLGGLPIDVAVKDGDSPREGFPS